jgi:hypothetical protein
MWTSCQRNVLLRSHEIQLPGCYVTAVVWLFDSRPSCCRQSGQAERGEFLLVLMCCRLSQHLFVTSYTANRPHIPVMLEVMFICIDVALFVQLFSPHRLLPFMLVNINTTNECLSLKSGKYFRPDRCLYCACRRKVT